MAAERKYDESVLKQIKELIDEHRSCGQIADELGIPLSTLKKIAAREGWHFDSAPQEKASQPRTLNVDHVWDRLLRAKAK